MGPRERITHGLVLIAQNPGSLLFIVPLFVLLIPVAMIFLLFYLLIKFLEIVLARKRMPPPKQIEAPPILLMKDKQW
jgi:hypothetical protein